MIANITKFDIGLNIHLISFELTKKSIVENDTIEVCITTIPEEKRENYITKYSNINSHNQIFSLNITNHTSKIIIVFRKKTICIGTPIIALSSLYLHDFSNFPEKDIQNETISTDVQKINLYSPSHKPICDELHIQCHQRKTEIDGKVIGQFEIQLSYTCPLIYLHKKLKTKKKETKRTKCKKIKVHEKKSEYIDLNNDNNLI